MTIHAMAEYMVRGYHDERKFHEQTLTYTLTGMTDEGAGYVRTALDWISDVTDLRFTEVSGPAHITGYSSGLSTFAVSNVDGGRILSSDIYVPHGLASFGTDLDYQMTVAHELLHALGLGHPGPYNGAGGTAEDRIFFEDTLDGSVASYFGEHTAPGLKAADVVALQLLYGRDAPVPAYEATQGLVIEADAYATIIGTPADDVITLVG